VKKKEYYLIPGIKNTIKITYILAILEGIEHFMCLTLKAL